jgi:cytochrome c556
MELRKAACGLGALLVASGGCSAPAQKRYEERLGSASGGEVHAIHSERLEELMRSLDTLAHDRLPKSLDLAPVRDVRLGELARVARGMAEAAAEIPRAAGDPVAGAELEDGAVVLRQQALSLAAAADAGDLDAARDHARAIEDACAGCHERFREPE